MTSRPELGVDAVEEPDEPLFRFSMPSGAVSRDAVRLLGRRRWLLTLLGVVALSVVFVELGFWQYHRHEAKVARRDVVRSNYDAAPRPVEQILGPSVRAAEAPLPADLAWTPVTATGEYASAGQLVVRNRPHDGDAGFEVLEPLRLADGTVFVIDRGWLPAADEGAQAPTSVPAAPQGVVRVTARVRPFEPAEDREPPAGQVLRIDRAHVLAGLAAAGVEGPVLAGYGVLAEEQPAAGADAPALLPRPDVDLGVHFAYAVQWWFFAFALYLVFAVALYREAEAATSGVPDAQATRQTADTTPRDVTVRVERPPFE